MPKIPMTEKWCEKVAAPQSGRDEYWDSKRHGLLFAVQQSGSKSWQFRYRMDGRSRRMTIGPYPAVGLADARRKALDAAKAVADGLDPGQSKLDDRRSRADEANRVEAVIDQYLRQHVRIKRKVGPAAEIERLFERDVTPVWGTRAIQRITKADVEALIRRLVDRGSPIAANRLLAHVKGLLNWCVRKDIISASPAKGIDMPGEEAVRDRVLSNDEIRWLWKASDHIGELFGDFTKLALLTAQRREEIAQAPWQEFELGTDESVWVIPGERTKNKEANVVPLPPTAIDILRRRKAFRDAVKSDKPKPLLVFTTTGTTPASGFSKAKSRLDAKMLEIARQEAAENGSDVEAVAIPAWRFHDLRRTAATGLARLGVAVHVTEALLNHKSGTIKGVARVYNWHTYLPEKRQALLAWEADVLRIVENMPVPSNVARLSDFRRALGGAND